MKEFQMVVVRVEWLDNEKAAHWVGLLDDRMVGHLVHLRGSLKVE